MELVVKALHLVELDFQEVPVAEEVHVQMELEEQVMILLPLPLKEMMEGAD